jgi:hypothetical protein
MPYNEGVMSEEEIRRIFQMSVDSFGLGHTHDFECVTWRGQNWAGACNCTLKEREKNP